MDEEICWLKGIMLDPDDDVRRLAYADWLEERGSPADEARAKFIRSQIQNPRAEGLSQEETAWHASFEDEWLGLPKITKAGMDQRIFARGFPHRWHVDAKLMIDAWLREPTLAPIEHLALQVSEVSMSWLQLEPPSPMLPLRSLSVTCFSPVGHYLPIMLQRFGPLPRLDSLLVQDDYFADEELRMLLSDDSYPYLQQLAIPRCGLTDEAAEWLATSAWVGRLKSLNVLGNRISPSRMSWLRERFGEALVEG
jgi:uncharacterized protein (TIGR02996 family)